MNGSRSGESLQQTSWSPVVGAVEGRHALAASLWLVGLLTAVRLIGLFLSPVELYPEEAQYWLWSRHLAFGYFSKPPMIAWVIAATTVLGDSEPFVRLAAPIAHGIAALALQRTGARLYGGWVGFWAALLYSVAPGVQLSSAVIATDCLVMMFAALATLAYAGWLTASDAGVRLRWAAGLGLALGLGALSKYAIVYLVLGLLLHALASPYVRQRWRLVEVVVVAGLALVVLAPNLAWNAAHGFQTVTHTAHDAAWRRGPVAARPHAAAGLMNARQTPGFLIAQLGVFGPIPFIALAIGSIWAMRRRGALPSADAMLLALTGPALVLILAESLIARANANWAAVAYVPAAVLTAAWLVRWRARLWLGLAAASQGTMFALFFAMAVSPQLADRLGMANSFKRARGWRTVEALTRAQIRDLGAASLSAVAVDDRFTYNALAYYGRSLARSPGIPPLRMWVREIRPGNEAETSTPLPPGAPRVLFVDIGGAYRAEAMRDFAHVRTLGAWKVWTDARHFREVYIFLGEGYHRRPRDPATGLPAPA